MIRTNFCLLALLFVVTMPACKKEKKNNNTTTPPTDTTVVYDNYTQLKPGNYWIYQDYRLDSINGEAHAEGTYDSNYVEKDTLINGKTYHKYCDVIFGTGSTPEYSISFLRDSLSYTVNEKGIIQFSSQDFTSVFRTYTFGPNFSTPDTLIVTERMGFKDATTVVDAGSFTTSAFRRIYQFPAGYPFGSTREYDYKYAKNIGLISETTAFYTASPMVFERRLVRYHVQ